MDAIEELVSRHFHIEPPFSSTDLKRAYKKRCLELHPDIGGSTRDFMEMQKAYSAIMEHAGSLFQDEEEFLKVKVTLDGTPLSELGLGLGPANGCDCPKCDHRGYIALKQQAFTTCPHCIDGLTNKRTFDCKYCNGTGKFTQRRSGRVVDCKACNGSGEFVKTYPRARFCEKCGGSAVTKDTNKPPDITYHRCWECKGTGELPMWNPVLPKSVMR